MRERINISSVNELRVGDYVAGMKVRSISSGWISFTSGYSPTLGFVNMLIKGDCPVERERTLRKQVRPGTLVQSPDGKPCGNWVHVNCGLDEGEGKFKPGDYVNLTAEECL